MKIFTTLSFSVIATLLSTVFSAEQRAEERFVNFSVQLGNKAPSDIPAFVSEALFSENLTITDIDNFVSRIKLQDINTQNATWEAIYAKIKNDEVYIIEKNRSKILPLFPLPVARYYLRSEYFATYLNDSLLDKNSLQNPGSLVKAYLLDLPFNTLDAKLDGTLRNYKPDISVKANVLDRLDVDQLNDVSGDKIDSLLPFMSWRLFWRFVYANNRNAYFKNLQRNVVTGLFSGLQYYDAFILLYNYNASLRQFKTCLQADSLKGDGVFTKDFKWSLSFLETHIENQMKTYENPADIPTELNERKTILMELKAREFVG